MEERTSVTTSSGATFVKAESNPRKSLRVLGALIALSSPISGILPFAILSAIAGEQRLENSNGLTGLGWFAMAIPALVGLAIIGWTFTSTPLPTRRTWQASLLGLATLFAATGAVLLGTANANDASIGGALLVLASLVVFGAVAFESLANKKK